MGAVESIGGLSDLLNDKTLLKHSALIGGQWVKAKSGAVFSVINPATGKEIAKVPNLSADDVKEAIYASDKSFLAWKSITGKERAAILRKWFNLISENTEDLALIMTHEQGKPLAESRAEIHYGSSFIEWFAEEAKRVTGAIPSTTWSDKRLMVLKQAIGVCVAITPWNFPSAMITRNRFYVHKKVHDQFVEKFALATKAIKVGSGLEQGVTQGPLIDNQALAKVQKHIADAISKGAQVVTGGKVANQGGTFFEPTVLANANNSMLVAYEETFGPVAPVIPFDSDEEVVQLANHSQFGLASYFYSRDIGRIWKVSEALEFGMVGVNTGLFSNEVGPFGGIKQSGLGREGSSWGIDEYLEMKYVCVGL